MLVEASLASHFVRKDGTGLELEVALVMRREYSFHIYDRPFFIAFLGVGRENAFADRIGGVVVRVISDLTAASFGTPNVEAVRAVLGGGIVRRSSKPNGIERCRVIARAGGLEVPVGVDLDAVKGGQGQYYREGATLEHR
jgi:hypothetical protein